MTRHAVSPRIASALGCLAVSALVAGCGETDLLSPPTDLSTLVNASLPSQQVAAPVYYSPTSPGWNEVLAAMPTAKIIVITGDNSGPGTQVAPHLTRMLDNAHARGSLGVGYIHVQWGGRSIAAVKAEIDRWYRFYPGLDGIFVDEVAGSDCASARAYYKVIHDYVKSRRSTATVIINPGTAVDACYLDAATIVVTFEGSFAKYQNEWSYANRGWETPGNAHRIWHIIHTTTSAQWRTALDLSRARSAGKVYVTHLAADPTTNTYGAPPPYFREQVANVKAYRGGTGTTPTALSRWSAWNDGVNVRYGMRFSQPFSFYRVYIDSDQSAATGFSVSGTGADYLVENGTVYAYRGPGWNWTPIGGSGLKTTSNSVSWTIPRALIRESGFPNAAFLSFEAETKGRPIQNAGTYEHVYSPATGRITGYFAESDARNVYYQANFSTAFTFQHVFIDTDARASTGYAYGAIGAEYMIEGSRLYRSTGRGWAWTPIGPVASTGGATGVRTWTVPRSVLGETAAIGESANVVFNGSGGPPEFSTPVYRHAYSP
jgi:hypothetical protein